MTLFGQYFRAHVRGLLLWTFFVGLFVLAIAANAPTFATDNNMQNLLEMMPPAIVNMMGNTVGLAPIDAFITMELGSWNAMLLSLYAVMLSLGVVTREVDRRTIDFLLAMPVDRRQVLLARMGVVAANTALLASATWLLLYLPLGRAGFEADMGGYGLMLFNQWLLAMALAGLCLLSSMWIDDYSFGVKLWSGVVATGMFLEWMLRAASLSRWARFWSPFSYVDAPEILRTGLPVADISVLLLLALLGFGLSVPAYERKQITI